jgi:hypothetical protein
MTHWTIIFKVRLFNSNVSGLLEFPMGLAKVNFEVGPSLLVFDSAIPLVDGGFESTSLVDNNVRLGDDLPVG